MRRVFRGFARRLLGGPWALVLAVAGTFAHFVACTGALLLGGRTESALVVVARLLAVRLVLARLLRGVAASRVAALGC